MKPQDALDLAKDALIFLSSDPDLIGAFLASAGASAQDLRSLVGQSEFSVALLDFLMQDDRRVLDFAASQGIDPHDVSRARLALGRPGDHNWSPD